MEKRGNNWKIEWYFQSVCQFINYAIAKKRKSIIDTRYGREVQRIMFSMEKWGNSTRFIVINVQ